MRILVASDGSKWARKAARLACRLARTVGAKVTLLGVIERSSNEDKLRRALNELQIELSEKRNCPSDVVFREGDAATEIMKATAEGGYHLVAVGPRGGRLRDLLVGTTTRRLVRSLKVPLLVVTGPPRHIKRILVCTSGEKPGEHDAYVAGALADLLDAEVTVLHVMSQVPLVPDASMDDLERDAVEMMQSGAREGEHLERLLAILDARGLEPEQRRAVIRRGLVLDEILMEAREGDYDLIVMGAHKVPETAPWHGLRLLLQEDLPAQVIRHTRRPVLLVNSLGPLPWETLDAPPQVP